MITRRHGKRSRNRRSGFTLIEVLTAIVVVAMITIACATMFNQATDSVTAGTRRAEWNILGRSLVHLIASEVSDSVFWTNTIPGAAQFEFTIETNGSGNVDKLSFVRMRNNWAEDSEGIRAATRITYRLLDDFTVERKSEVLLEGENMQYEADWTNAVVGAVGTNIYGLAVVPDPDWMEGEGLPRYMDVFVDLVAQDDIAVYQAQNGMALPSQGSQWVLDHAMTYQSRAYLRNRNRTRFE